MGISQAQRMLQQLQSQLTGIPFAQQAGAQLGGIGAGKIKAKKFFQTPDAESQLMDSVMQRLLGFYGGPQGGQRMPFPGQEQPQMFPGQTSDFLQKGPQMQPGFGMPQQRMGDPISQIYAPGFDPSQMQKGPQQMPGFGGGIPQEQLFPIGGGGAMQGGAADFIPSLDNPQRPFTSGATSVEDMISRLWDQGQATQSMQGTQVASQNPWQQIGLGGGLPNLDPLTQSQLGSIFQPQMDQMNADFGQQKDAMLQDLFGRGMAQSTAATDAGGKLLTGRSTAMNQILGQKAQAELGLRQQLMEQIGSKAAAGQFAGGGSFAGGMGSGQSPAASMLGSVLHDISGSDRALNFDQRMAQAELELKRAQLQQQGSLGGRELDIQQMLGLGSQGLQGQGLTQDFMSQLLGMGLQRQQGAAGLASSEAQRLQQFLQGQQGLIGGIGQQQAQQEAQRRSLFSQIMGGLLGGVSSLAGGALSGGLGLGQIFGGRPATGA